MLTLKQVSYYKYVDDLMGKIIVKGGHSVLQYPEEILAFVIWYPDSKACIQLLHSNKNINPYFQLHQ